MESVYSNDSITVDKGLDPDGNLTGHNLKTYLDDLNERMRNAAANLEFEEAAGLRDEIRRLEHLEIGVPAGPRRLRARIDSAKRTGRNRKTTRKKTQKP